MPIAIESPQLVEAVSENVRGVRKEVPGDTVFEGSNTPEAVRAKANGSARLQGTSDAEARPEQTSEGEDGQGIQDGEPLQLPEGPASATGEIGATMRTSNRDADPRFPVDENYLGSIMTKGIAIDTDSTGTSHPSPLSAPAITNALDRKLGRRSSSSFSSVHFADSLPPHSRQRTDSNVSLSGSLAGTFSSIGYGREGIDPSTASPSSILAPVPSSTTVPPFLSDRLSVARPTLRSRSSDGSSRQSVPTLPSPFRRDSASGTSTPRASRLPRGSDRDRDAAGSVGTAERLYLRHQRSRTGSLVARGKRSRVVTGEHETSDSDSNGHETGQGVQSLTERVGSRASTGPSRSPRPVSTAREATSVVLEKRSDSSHGQNQSHDLRARTYDHSKFGPDASTSFPHGDSASSAASRRRAKSLTVGSLGSPRRPTMEKEVNGELRPVYGIHTPPPAMDRGGSDKAIHHQRNAPVTSLIESSRSSPRIGPPRLGSSPKHPLSAFPTISAGSTSIINGPSSITGSSGVFSRGPSRMPSHHSMLSARSSSHFASNADTPHTPPGPSRNSSRLLQTTRADDIPETPSPRSGVDTPDTRELAVASSSRPLPAKADAPSDAADISRSHRRRDKGKQRARTPRRDGLAATLGMGGGGREAVLTAEQIQALLASSDIASALRPGAALSTTTSWNGTGRVGDEDRDNHEPYRDSDRQSGAAGQGRHEPYLASAPPALTSGTPNDKFPRERTISISTIGTPARRRDWGEEAGEGSSTTHDGAGDRGRDRQDLRKRTLSNATTASSSGHNSGSLARRRASSRASHGESEGHVAFTHFPRPDRPVAASAGGPFVESDEELGYPGKNAKSSEEEDRSVAGATVSTEATSSRPGVASSAATGRPKSPASTRTKLIKSISTSGLGVTPDQKGKRHRSISAIFHLGSKSNAAKKQKRKSDSMHALSSIASAHEQTEAETAEAERLKAEKEAKEVIMRQKEAQRREDEEGQERYYRALMQVTAHPHSIKLSDRAKVHLWAYYRHVYDGLDDPPRLNPLAVIRWRSRTQEQEDRRRAWEEEHGHSISNGDNLKHHKSSINNSLSPMSNARPLHLTPSPSKPRSVALSDPSQSHRSLNSDSSRGHFGLFPGRSGSRRSEPRSRWTYTINDIEAYKAAEGVVRYFIPPALPSTPAKASQEIPRADELTALEHPDEQDDESARQLRLGDANSSIGGSIGRGAVLRFSNEGTSREQVDEMGVIAEGRPLPMRNASYLNGSRTSVDALSRSVSRDTDRGTSLRRGHGGGSLRKSASTHRHNHSISLTSKLKAPFEKLGEFARDSTRRQSTSPYPHGHLGIPGGDNSDTQDDTPHRHRVSPSARNSISLQPGVGLNLNGMGSRKASRAQLVPSEPQSAIASAHPHSVTATPISANMTRARTSLWRGRGHANGNGTDVETDNEPGIGLRRGFKGSITNLRRHGRAERDQGLPTINTAAGHPGPIPIDSGVTQQSAQVPDVPLLPSPKSQRAIDKSQADAVIYSARAAKLAEAQKRLAAVEKTLEYTMDAGSRYLTDMESLRQRYHNVVDLDVVWDGIDDIATSFAPAAGAETGFQRQPSIPRPAQPKRGLPHHMRTNVHPGSTSGSESDHLRMVSHRRGSHRQSHSTGSAVPKAADLGLDRPNANSNERSTAQSKPDALVRAREAIGIAQAQYDDMRGERTKAEGLLRRLLTDIDDNVKVGKERLEWFERSLQDIYRQKGIIARLQPPPRTSRLAWFLKDAVAKAVVSTGSAAFRAYLVIRKPLRVKEHMSLREGLIRGFGSLLMFTSFFVLVGLALFALGAGDGPVHFAETARQVRALGWRGVQVSWAHAKAGCRSMYTRSVGAIPQ